MKNSERTVVEKVFASFSDGNTEKFTETVSDDMVWIYQGTQIIPKNIFDGKDGIPNFINNILSSATIMQSCRRAGWK